MKLPASWLQLLLAGTIRVLAIGPNAGVPLPIIDEQPIGRAVTPGSPTSLSVGAHGSGTLGYRWWKDGQPLTNDTQGSGATGAVLSVETFTTTNAGAYSVVVTNAGGAVTSSVVSLVATQFTVGVVGLGSTGALVSVRGQPADVYRVEVQVDFGPWVTNGYATNYTGTATFIDKNTGGSFRFFRAACIGILPTLSPMTLSNGVPMLRAYGKLNEKWVAQGTSNYVNWDDISVITNTTGWLKVLDTNAPSSGRFYRIAVQ